MTSNPESSFEAMLREAAELRAPSPDELCLPVIGELLQGKYRIEERLGVGGMGAVFRATNTENGKQVAIKWLLQRSAGASARFSLEARVAARIDHPNVVNVFDIGTHDGRTFLVMELMRGSSLRKRLKAGRLTPSELVAVMLPVLRGVRAAHAAGVIHRDLKPDNVFLCSASDGTQREPKVLDFGISKLRGTLPQSDRLTAEGTRVGTLAYMSPEQLVDAPEVDERTDVYAAGVMMYEALVGELPFRAKGHNALVLAIATQKPPPIRARAPDVDIELERVVLRAMAKDVSERQANVDVLLEELSRWQAASSRSSARARTRALRTGLSLALGVLAVAFCAWSLTRASGTPRAAVHARTGAEVALAPVEGAVSPMPATTSRANGPAVAREATDAQHVGVDPRELHVGRHAAVPASVAQQALGHEPRATARPKSEAPMRVPSRAGALRRSEL